LIALNLASSNYQSASEDGGFYEGLVKGEREKLGRACFEVGFPDNNLSPYFGMAGLRATFCEI